MSWLRARDSLGCWAAGDRGGGGGSERHAIVVASTISAAAGREVMGQTTPVDRNGVLTFLPMKRARWVTIYAIAMAAVESAVVVYLRALHDGVAPASVLQYQLPMRFLTIEVGREAATLVMLIAVAAIAGRNTWERFLYFALAFGVWDIFYYVWLWVFIGWPPSLWTWDVLFLIPVPWLGPVLAPVIVSLCLVGGALWLLHSTLRLSRRAWVLASVGAALVLLSFTIDYHYALTSTEPPRFRWEVFLAGIVIGVIGVGWDRALKRRLGESRSP